jgi:hypothetical protein
VASHQPPQTLATGPLRPLTPREPPTRPLRLLTPREPPAGLLWPSATGPHRSKPQERSHVGVRRPKCPVNKNNDKNIKRSSKVIMNDDV